MLLLISQNFQKYIHIYFWKFCVHQPRCTNFGPR